MTAMATGAMDVMAPVAATADTDARQTGAGYSPPDPIWNSPANEALGKFLAQLNDVRATIEDGIGHNSGYCLEDLNDVFQEGGLDLSLRLGLIATVIDDQLTHISSMRVITDAEHRAIKAGQPLAYWQ